MRDVSTEKSIRQIVRSSVESYADGFEARHIGEADDPDGTINMKIHNIFIAALGEEIQYYTALVRSLDSVQGTPYFRAFRGHHTYFLTLDFEKHIISAWQELHES